MQKWLLSLLLICTTLWSTLYAEDKPQAVIIFDASGSMWGKVDGAYKIAVAKDALNSVVKKWNPNVALGLTVYGHRRKGDCNDIETVIPVGIVDKEQIISIVKKIQPRGKTPITRSLKKVANELKYSEEKATIILISDGKESCDADPCGAAKELEDKGIDFVIHVIGFNVDKQTDRELECIANVTGGEYFSAKNATALNEAMKSIVQQVEKVEKITPKPVVKKLEDTLEISASEKKGSPWVDTSYWIYPIVDDKKEESSIASPHSGKKEIARVALAAGKYMLHAEYNKFTKEREVEIKTDKVTKVHIVFSETGEVEITAAETEDGKRIKSFHRIYLIVDGEKQKEIAQCYSNKKKICVRQLPIGTYTIHSEYNKFTKDSDFTLKASEVTKVHIAMGTTGTIEITAAETEGGKGVKSFHRIYPIVDGEKQKEIAQCYSNKKKICVRQLPIGTYTIHSEYNKFTKDSDFSLKVGEVTKVHIAMGTTGKVEIATSEVESGKAFHRIYPIVDGEKQKEIAQCYSDKKKICVRQLPIGTYTIHSEYNKFTKDSNFVLKAGKVTKVEIELNKTKDKENENSH